MPLSSQKEIINALKTNYILNANDLEVADAYMVCADKQRLDRLINPKKEVIFGRRGTGKTVILKAFTHYINTQLYNGGLHENLAQHAVYINIDKLLPSDGSGSINDLDSSKKTEVLLSKILDIIAKDFEYEFYACDIDSLADPGRLLDLIEEFQKVIRDKSHIIKKITIKETEDKSKHLHGEVSVGVGSNGSSGTSILSIIKSLFSFGATAKKANTKSSSAIIESITSQGYDIQLLSQLIQEIAERFEYDQLYYCIDELTFIDKHVRDLQIYVVQIIKELLFGSRIIAVKAAAHWNLSKLQSRDSDYPRLGMELNEDYTAAFDLDAMFLDNEQEATSYFLELMINQCLLYYSGDTSKIRNALSENILSYLFGENPEQQRFMFQLLICGSHGISRSFCNILDSCIAKMRSTGKSHITYETLFECILHEFTINVSRKNEYESTVLNIFDEHLKKKTSRLVLLQNKDYNANKREIENLVERNYLHQYPSAKIPKEYRNKYKMFTYHLGNYLEVCGNKSKKLTIEQCRLFPDPPDTNSIADYILSFSEIVI